MGMLVATGDSCARPTTPPLTTSCTTRHTAAANVKHAAEGISASTRYSCTHATLVTLVPTHSVTGQAPMTMTPPTPSWTTDYTAAAYDKYRPNHVLVASGDS